MMFLDHFRDQLIEARGDNQLLQMAFLHFCFPDNYPAADLGDCRATYAKTTYKIVAADGFMAAKHITHADVQFEAGLKWLMRIPLPADLPLHGSALLGLALGTRVKPSTEIHAWWQALLVRVRGYSPTTAEMLEMLLGLRQMELSPEEQDVRLLAAGLMCEPPIRSAESLAHFLMIWRKEPFDANGDFFLNVLRIYVMDAALLIVILAERQADQLQRSAMEQAIAQQFQKTQAALQAQATRRARVWVGGLALIGLLVIIASCMWLYVWDPAASQSQMKWKQIEWAFFLLSGPVAATLTLARILYFLYQGQKLDLDLQSLADRLKTRILRRWQRRLMLPFSLNHPGLK